MPRQRRYERIYDVVEPVEDYRPGGYHPVHLGDVFASRYKIIRKLSFGQFSTVWLANDVILHSYVALKISKAKGENDSEVEILNDISRCSKNSTLPGRDYILTPVDSFYHKGPNGSHLCLVLPVMGIDCQAYTRALPGGKFPPEVARAVARHLTLGLEFLESCGVVHNDLQPRNIVFAASDADIQHALQDTENEQCEIKWLPEIQPDNSAPEYVVIPEPIYSRSRMRHMSLETNKVRITDFGSATHVADVFFPVNPRAFRAPEHVGRTSCVSDFKSDIWSLGCLIYEFTTGVPLFSLGLFGSSDEDIEMIYQQMLAEIIHPDLDTASAATKFCNHLEYYLMDVEPEEKAMLANMLRKNMLIVQSGMRKRPTELLKESWLHDRSDSENGFD